MIKGNVDVHCHFFNVGFAFEELLDIGWRWLHGNYPYKSEELMMPKGKFFMPPEVQGIVEYVASFFATAVRSPRKNHEYELYCYKESDWHSFEPLSTVPLMMDIFFILDKGAAQKQKTRLQGMPATQKKAALTPPVLSKSDMALFDAFAEDMKQRVLDAFGKRVAGRGPKRVSEEASDKLVIEELDCAISEFKAALAPEAAPKGPPSGRTVQMTRGYQKHLVELRKLKIKNPETVFPFLAVDPRRIGVEKLLLDQVVKGSFKGVKLYCPLGYLPSHPDLFPVYRICAERDIPVTAHTSPGGLPSVCDQIATLSRMKDGSVIPVVFDKKSFMETHQVGKGESAQSLFFADPDNWHSVLESGGLGRLRLNLAHFGGEENIIAYANGSTDLDNWTGKIIRLMEQFDNVYTDISFCPGEKMLDAIDKIIARHDVVKDRLMFGTDFVMIMMHRCGLKNYFNRYTGINPDMITTNPKAFLG